MTKLTTPQSNPKAPEYDVVIVGLGPVGATLAGLLGSFGNKVLAIDAAPGIYDMPRAIGMDHETMRVFQQLGITDDLAPFISAYKRTEYRTSTGEVIRGFVSQDPPYSLGWPPYLTFIQPDLERTLRKHVDQIDTVTPKTSHALVNIETVGSMSKLTLRSTDKDALKYTTARYVVGCDGGSSLMRKLHGISLEDLTFDEPWLVVDMLINEDVNLPDLNIQFCDPERPHTFVVGPNNLRRWEFMLKPGEAPDEMSKDDQVWQLLARWLAPDQAKLWRATTYRFHALVAEKWRDGNVFLAGDACHMTPPFLAQGMVQGIKDAANLAWKIDAVLKGAAPDLLDSYESERRPLVREVIAITKDLGRIIGETDPQKAAARDTKMRQDMAQGRGVTIRANLFPPIQPSVVCRAGIGHTSGAGKPAPQPSVKTTQGWKLLDEITGHSFAILALPGFEIPATTVALLEKHSIKTHVIGPDGGGQLLEKNSVFADWMAENNAGAILVRPDHIVLAAALHGDQLERDLQAVARFLPDPNNENTGGPDGDHSLS